MGYFLPRPPPPPSPRTKLIFTTFRVSKCSSSNVISNEAYLLFFELSWRLNVVGHYYVILTVHQYFFQTLSVICLCGKVTHHPHMESAMLKKIIVWSRPYKKGLLTFNWYLKMQSKRKKERKKGAKLNQKLIINKSWLNECKISISILLNPRKIIWYIFIFLFLFYLLYSSLIISITDGRRKYLLYDIEDVKSLWKKNFALYVCYNMIYHWNISLILYMYNINTCQSCLFTYAKFYTQKN